MTSVIAKGEKAASASGMKLINNCGMAVPFIDAGWCAEAAGRG